MRQAIVLALEQAVQAERGREPTKRRPIGAEAARDDRVRALYGSELCLERGRFVARRIVWSAVARRKLDQLPTRRPIPGERLGHHLLKDFAIARRRYRQPVLVVPGRE